jgi:hypothetical protein
MGMRPCDIHGGRYSGPANHLYPAMIHGDERVSRRWSCCADCFRLVTEWAELHLEMITGDTPLGHSYETYTCPGCGEDAVEGSVMMFLTAYRSHQPRVDFFGRTHEPCSAALEVPLGITPLHWTQEPLTAA